MSDFPSPKTQLNQSMERLAQEDQVLGSTETLRNLIELAAANHTRRRFRNAMNVSGETYRTFELVDFKMAVHDAFGTPYPELQDHPITKRLNSVPFITKTSNNTWKIITSSHGESQ